MFQFSLAVIVLYFSKDSEAFPPKDNAMLDGRIVGGQRTTIEEFPWQVSLRYGKRHACGGSIYNATTVITAGHCINPAIISSLTVGAGATKRTEFSIEIAVTNAIVHPNFNIDVLDADIAVLFLSETLPLSKSISAIELPEIDKDPKIGSVALVSGWGTMGENQPSSDHLQFVGVRIIDQAECRNAYKIQGKITPSMICACDIGRDACQGDSGGPMVVNNTLVGIVSWGYGCARPEYPGVYSRVSNLRKWLDSVLL